MKLLFLPLVCEIYATSSFSIPFTKSTSRVTLRSSRTDIPNTKWSLEQDWILQDAVPRYTVVSNKEQRATFWNQLKYATPELQGFQEFELMQRYDTLKINNKEENLAGPAPVVLSDWWFHDTNKMMGGLLSSNESMIWFFLKGGGKLEQLHQHPKVQLTDCMELHTPGGFVETQDGVIYELGLPATLDKRLQPKENMDTSQRVAYDWLLDSTRLLDRNTRKMVLLIITVSSLLSATLAFQIGQQMTSLPSQHSHAITVTVLHNRESATAITSSSSQSTVSSTTEISIAEQRARQELMVLREKRASQKLQERIQRDEETLFLLQREETQQEGAALGFY